MTVQELIDILRDRDPTDVVCVETQAGTVPVMDDWSRCQFEHDSEQHHGFCLLALSDDPLDDLATETGVAHELYEDAGITNATDVEVGGRNSS